MPLESTRTLDISTDEGTWLSVDVSPDGKSVVFDLLGDLYSIPIEGGTATRITEGMAFDSQPRYSPDGRWIAFISDRDGSDNLWVVKTDGTSPRQLSKEKGPAVQSPAWMPDSQYVLVSREGNRGLSLWMYHVQGGSGVEVTATGEEKETSTEEGSPAVRLLHQGAAVSPDGRYVYFARQNAKGVYNQMSFDWQVYRRDLITGDTDRITQGHGGGFRPVLSPDGKKLVYGTRREAETGLRIRDLDAGTDLWLKFPIQRDDMESRGTRDLLPSYSFIPRGDEIVVFYGGKIRRVDTATGDVREVPFKVDASLEVGPLLNFPRRTAEGPVQSRLILDAVQSPDGKRIAFSAMARLYVMELADLTIRPLSGAEPGEFKPAWSPDGSWLTYVTWDYAGQGHIWRTRWDGSSASAPQRLTDAPAFYTDPEFSPDGTRIVALRGNAWMRSQTPSEFGGLRIDLDLIWLPADGGETRLIVPARGLSGPHFSKESDRVYFYSRDGLVSMRYDGTDRKTHLKIKGKKLPGRREAPSASEAQISPDGRWALGLLANQLYLMAVPPLAGNSPTLDLSSPSVPAKQLTDVGADSFGWADNGETVTWSVGRTFYRRPFNSIPLETEKKGEETEGGEESEDSAGTAQPDEAAKASRETDASVESFEVSIQFPRHKPQGTLVFKGGTVVSMRGEEVIEDCTVVVVDNRITAVGRDVSVPSGTHVIDVRGKFLLPGFVDTHAHYEMRTAGVLELHNWSFLANLAYGVTTGLDVQTSTNDYLVYQDLVEAGMMNGPRAYSTGPGVFSSNDFQSYEAARHVLERYKTHYANENLKSYMVGNRKQRQWVAMAARELGLTVTTEGGLDLKLDMTHALDGFGGNEHSLPIVPLYRDVVELFARSQTAYTPTLLVLYGGPWAENFFYETLDVHDDPKLNRFTPHNEIDRVSKRRPWFREDEHAFSRIAAQAAKIQRSGGLVGVGGHGQLQGLGYHWEMWALAMGGMTSREVLKAATIDGARIIGLAQDLGSVEAGKLADMVVLDKDPLADIRNTTAIRYIVKNGQVFEGDTLREVWPEVKECPEFWWWGEQGIR